MMKSERRPSVDTLLQPLSGDELQQLANFLQQQGGLTLFQAHGLLCALISGPHSLPIEAWLTAICGEEKPVDAVEDIDWLLNGLMRLYHHIADRVTREDGFIPLVDYQPLTSWVVHELTEGQQENLTGWCQGYLQGIRLDGVCWDAGATEELILLVFPIVTLAQGKAFDPVENRGLFKHPPTPEELQTLLTTVKEMLPSIIPSIYDYWREQDLLDNVPKTPTKKKGRNATCPCGSGKKFKKCCLTSEGIIH